MFLQQRNKTYHFRRRVPVELRSILGKREIIKSLRTEDRVQASIKAAELIKQTNKLFADALSQYKCSVFYDLTTEEINQFCARYLYLRVAEIDELRLSLGKEFRRMAHETFAAEIEASEAMLKKSLALGDYELFADVLPVFLREQGVELSSQFPQQVLDALNLAFLKANVTLLNHKKMILEGNVVELVEPVQISKPVSKTKFTILDAFKSWCAVRKRNPKTTQEMERVATHFYEFNSSDLSEVTKKDIHSFFTKKSHLSKETLVKHSSLLRALCTCAVDQEQAAANPFTNFRMQIGQESVEREGFSKSDIEAIFGGKFVQDDPQVHFLCTLALITGARIEELCQLKAADVLIEDGVTVISINRDGKNKIKNASSIRKIPIHPAFLEALNAYVGKRRGGLFDFQGDKFGRLSSGVGKKLNRYFRNQLKFPVTKTFHSFRHTFKTMCRDCGLPEEIHDALTGHSSGKVGRHYGDYSTTALFDAILKLNFPFVPKGTQKG